MYRTAYQRDMLTIFFSVGSKPLAIWDVFAKDGYVTRFLDQDIKSMVLEIRGNNVSTTYMVCPSKNRILGISMPFLVMIVKNLKKYFSFEVTILDDTGTRRRFRVSNFQSTTQIMSMCTAMPIGLSDGWNQIQFNLAEFTRRTYKKQYVEVQKIKINANIRLRRIYFTERLVPEDELPPEYKLFFPLENKGAKDKKKKTENVKPSTSQQVAVPEEKKAVEPESLKASSKVSIHSVKVEAPVSVEVEALPDGNVAEEIAGPGKESAGADEETAVSGGEPAGAGEETADTGETEVTAVETTPGEGEPVAVEAPAEGEAQQPAETEQSAVENSPEEAPAPAD